MNSELQEKLETLAYKRTIPFCYSCYSRAPSGRCEKCHSDDLMRELPGSGVEYGLSWVIDEILETELDAVGTAEAFEESVRGCYSETVAVLWMNLDAVSVAKEMDPISWDIAKSEWIDQEVEEGNLIAINGGEKYFWSHDVERLVGSE
jgi:hypothetical protein